MHTIPGIFSDMRPLPRWGKWDLTRAFLKALECGDNLSASLVNSTDTERTLGHGIPSIFQFPAVRR